MIYTLFLISRIKNTSLYLYKRGERGRNIDGLGSGQTQNGRPAKNFHSLLNSESGVDRPGGQPTGTTHSLLNPGEWGDQSSGLPTDIPHSLLNHGVRQSTDFSQCAQVCMLIDRAVDCSDALLNLFFPATFFSLSNKS